MATFLKEDFIALSLINSKDKLFHESSITTSELSEYTSYLQKEFNSRDSDVIITSNGLDKENFNIMGDAITISKNCGINTNFIPLNVLSVLNDNDLIINFWMQLEKEKLKSLENIKNNSKVYKKSIFKINS